MILKEFSKTVLEKGRNEVKYWLKDHDRTLSDEQITRAANEALTLFVDKDWSSLEAAVDFTMSKRRFQSERKD